MSVIYAWLSVQMWMGQVMVLPFLLQANTSLFSRERGNKKERNFFPTFLTFTSYTQDNRYTLAPYSGLDTVKTRVLDVKKHQF